MLLAQRLAARIIAATRLALPANVEAKARRHIADTLGISLVAMRGSAEVAAALRAALAGGASGRARVIGSAAMLPPVQAAFVNSAAAHALDFDDVHDLARLHVSAVTLPAALAAADVHPAGAARLLHAVALGNDTMCRLGISVEADATGSASKWLLTQLIGYLGAAVAAGIVLELDEDALVSALGLAYMQAAGGKETAMGTGSNVRAIYPGFAAAGGFSYGDVLGGGSGWAKSILLNTRARDEFNAFFARGDSFALGVCNGCQMMSQLRELIPGAEHWPRFLRNRSEQFEARLVMVEVTNSPSLFFRGMAGSRMPVVTAHGEGRAVFASDKDRASAIVSLRYVNNAGAPTEVYPANPNGSPEGITGLTTADGRFTILMPHPERVFRSAQMSWHPREWGEASPWLRMFVNARSSLG